MPAYVILSPLNPFVLFFKIFAMAIEKGKLFFCLFSSKFSKKMRYWGYFENDSSVRMTYRAKISLRENCDHNDKIPK